MISLSNKEKNIFIGVSLLVSFLMIPAAFAELPCAPVRVRSCPGITNKAELVGVYIDDCWDEPCVVRKGKAALIEADFELKGPVSKLTAKFTGKMGELELPLPGGDKDVCASLASEGDCPFKQGDYVTYAENLFLDPAWPSVDADVRVRLVDERGDIQICWMVKVQVR